jgi:hypothetical protein
MAIRKWRKVRGREDREGGRKGQEWTKGEGKTKRRNQKGK